jgi:hypothetical protein
MFASAELQVTMPSELRKAHQISCLSYIIWPRFYLIKSQ